MPKAALESGLFPPAIGPQSGKPQQHSTGDRPDLSREPVSATDGRLKWSDSTRASDLLKS